MTVLGGEGSGGVSGSQSSGATGGESSGTSSSTQNAGGGVTQGGGGAGGATGTAATGGEAKSWRDSLPEDIRGNPAIGAFQDVPSLTKAFIHAQSLVGKKGAIVPGEKATDADWGEFYKAIGVPSADKYEIPLGKDVKVNENALKWFKENAAKNGLLPKQAAALLEGYTKFESDTIKAVTDQKAQQSTEALNGLKKEWGEAYEKEIAGAKLAVKELGGDEFGKYLNQTGLGNDVQVIKVLAKAAKLMGEDKLREGGVGSDDASTKSEIQSQINDIMANGMQNGYFDGKNPSHQIMVDKVASLRRRLTGGK